MLDAWRREPADRLSEARDLGTLKLFLGADPTDLAAGQLALHAAKLAEYEALAKIEMPPGARLALDSGIGHEKEYIRFWKRLA